MKPIVTEVTYGGELRFHVTKNGRAVSHATALAALKKAYPRVDLALWRSIEGRQAADKTRKPFRDHASVFTLLCCECKAAPVAVSGLWRYCDPCRITVTYCD